LLKCLAADVGSPVTATGNAARVYGTASGIATSTIAASVTGVLAAAITTAEALKQPASAVDGTTTALLEDKFKAWKTAALLSMTAYKLMIDTDTTFTLVTGTTGCKVDAGSGITVVTALNSNATYTAATATHAAVAAAVESATFATATAIRPSNLVGGITSVATSVKTLCENECKKLPSYGLKCDGASPNF
jgi:hypothetical protein